MEELIHSFKENKCTMEKEKENTDQCTKSLESAIAALEDKISSLDDEDQHSQKLVGKHEAARGQLSNELEKWRDIRAGTEDELGSELLALEKIQSQSFDKAKTSSMMVFDEAKREKEMNLFYDFSRCAQLLPELQSQIVSKQRDLKEYSKLEESLTNKVTNLYLKKKERAQLEMLFPNENVRQFIVKEGRKQRHAIVKKVRQVRLELFQLESEMPLTQDENTNPKVASD